MTQHLRPGSVGLGYAQEPLQEVGARAHAPDATQAAGGREAGIAKEHQTSFYVF